MIDQYGAAFSAPVTLTFNLLTSKLLCQDLSTGDLSSKFERSVVFRFRFNAEYGTDTDG